MLKKEFGESCIALAEEYRKILFPFQDTYRQASLEDMNENSPTCIIRPGSRKRLASIITNRQEAEAMALNSEDIDKATKVAVEATE